MPRFTLLLLLSIFFAGAIHSQESSLKGVLKDSSDNKNLQNSVISIIRATDSALVKFTRADAQGRFTIKGIKDSKVIMMITHPYFGDLFETIELPANAEKDLGTIYMISKSKLLAEVIVRSGSPIRIKGDTTIYTADSFKVREGANVEELLRRLPNVQIDQNGQITAMGEKVKNFLVDGEEFFGSDPGIATKNLRADMVKDVLIYDKKSDQATFTGIDDGVREKTIDLRLKDSKKNGYFGKVEAAGGLKDKYTNTAMLNAFQGKRKIAGYGFMSNTGRTELGFQDAQNYGGGIGETMVTEGGGIAIMISGDDMGQSFSGGRNGIPVNKNAGLHYSNKYNQDKVSLNTGYKLSDINAAGTTTTYSKTFLPDTAWYTNTRNRNSSSTLRQALNFTFDATIDSFNSIRWTGRGNKSDGTTASITQTEYLGENSDTANTVYRTNQNKNNSTSITSTLLWRHRYRKAGRTLSVNTDFNRNDNKTTSQLYSLNRIFNNGNFFKGDTLDQRNITDNEVMGITTRASYTEPLAKNIFMELSYSFSINSNKNNRATLKDDGTGKFQQRVDSLSNDFIFNRMVNTPGISFRVVKKKINYTLGSSVGFSRFGLKDVSNSTNTVYNFTNFFPRANITYTFKTNRSLRLNYSGSTNAPSLEQLQPIRNNTDQLNNYIGNPDLKQSFNHYLNGSFSTYNQMTQKNFYISGSFSLTQRAFVQSSVYDLQTRKRTYQTVNTNGVYNAYISSSYSIMIPETKWRLGVGPSFTSTQNVDFLTEMNSTNLVKNLTRTTGYGGNINIQYNEPNKYYFYVSPTFTINRTKGTVSTNANAKYWQLSGYISGSINITKTLYLESTANYQARQRDPRFGANSNFTIWDASIVQRFMKNTLDVKFSVNDIMNQNKGYSRNFGSNNFTESYFQTLKRFWLLTVTWNFAKNGKPATF